VGGVEWVEWVEWSGEKVGERNGGVESPMICDDELECLDVILLHEKKKYNSGQWCAR
jgi:hypothetical protein